MSSPAPSLAEALAARAAAQRGEPSPSVTIVVTEPLGTIGAGESAPPSLWAKAGPVLMSEDLHRIESLPRRPKFDPNDPAVLALVEELTARYRTPTGTMRLRPIQAFSLAEAERTGGLVAAQPVGAGKSLTSYLLPKALGVERAVLLVPPALKTKIFEIEYPALSKHWRLPNLEDGWTFPGEDCWLTVVAYSTLATAKTGDVLVRKAPQAIIADEAHRLKRRAAAQTKRAVRYLKANPGTKFAALSGSIATRSVTEMAGLMELALGEGSPLPTDWRVLQTWAFALDKTPGARPDPGELVRFSQRGEDVRVGVHRRLAETPGIVMTQDNTIPTALNIFERVVNPPKVVVEALSTLRRSYATPDGFQFDTALEQSRFARQLAAGFWQRRTWPRNEPPDLRAAWIEARNAWFGRVRDYLSSPHAVEGRDSPLLLFQAAQAGKWRVPEFGPWSEIKDQCEPDTEVVWVDDFLVRDAVEWGRTNKGIIWFQHRALGQAIAKAGGFALYQSREDGSALDREDGSRTVVVSQNAHREGRNLQHAFSKNLVTTPSSNGQVWEQLVGRTHREGQPEDEVEVHVYAYTPELSSAVFSAIEDARFAQELNGANQKLLTATFGFNPQPAVREKRGQS